MQDKYYLTNQQNEIKNKIINSVNINQKAIWGIKGKAGTGKTLLLYDIAKFISKNQKVCVIHSGILSSEHIKLNSMMKNVTIIAAKECNYNLIKEFDCIFIDESQRLYQSDYNCIIDAFKKQSINCIFAYDYNQVLAKKEKERNIPLQLKANESFEEFELTSRIRINKSLSSFIKNVIDLNNKPKYKMDYSSVEVLYADSYKSADEIITHYINNKKYKFIAYTTSTKKPNDIDYFERYTNTHHIIGQEFDNVIISMDNNFKYSDDGRLQGNSHPNPDYLFTKLWFQGVTRAREKLCIIIIGNEPLFNKILKVKMQG